MVSVLIRRSAAGDDVDDIEHAEGIHGAHDQRHQDRRAQQGQADLPEALPGIRAIHGGGLFQVRGQGGQGRLQDQRHERHGVPDVRHDHQVHGHAGQGQPGDIVLDQPQLHQQAIQGAEIAAVDPAPHRAVDDGRHCPRDDQAEAQELPAPGTRVDQLRNRQPQDQLQPDGDDGEVQGAPDRFPEGLVLQHVEVIAQTRQRSAPG